MSVATSGERLLKAAEEMRKETDIWLCDNIRLQWTGPGRGCGIVAVAPIKAGEKLLAGTGCTASVLSSELEYPWENEVFVTFCNSLEQEPGSGGAGSARLALRLSLLLIRLERTAARGPEALTELSAIERYIAACPSTDASPAQWPPEVLAELQGSALGAQALAEVADMEREAEDLLAAWPAEALSPPPGREEFAAAFRRATALVGTRAFATDGALGAMLCPVLDFLNHASKEDANATYGFGDKNFSLQAVKDIPAGAEVLACYDAEADFLELWARYGFFDETACVHTVEILVGPGGAAGAAGAAGASDAQAEAATPFWIPDQAVPLECPLLDMLEEAARGELGQDVPDSAVQLEALRRMAALIRTHLGAYSPLEEAVEAYRRGAPDLASSGDAPSQEAQRHSARGALLYEQRLLRGTLAKIEGIVAQ